MSNLINKFINNLSIKNLYFLLFIFLILLTGCSFLPAKKTFVPQTVDVMVAKDCGMDGLKCCATDPQCSYGQQCCVNPRNSQDNYCADKCGEGEENQFCMIN